MHVVQQYYTFSNIIREEWVQDSSANHDDDVAYIEPQDTTFAEAEVRHF